MKTIKLKDVGSEVEYLRKQLGLSGGTEFDKELESAVKIYQDNHNLLSDGIVGPRTWKEILLEDIEIEQVEAASKFLDIEPALLKTVILVEAGGSGFRADGKPKILFEGHIFWRFFRAPNLYLKGNEDVLYKNWTKAYYNQDQWERLEKARKINKSWADQSASWGMFQVMGMNYKLCGCNTINEFVTLMSRSERDQVFLGAYFLKSSGLIGLLKKHDWAGFAKIYNGPGYAQNKYDIKLKQTYDNIKR